MNRYEVKVLDVAKDLDLEGTISAPIQITNGRQDLNSSIGQTYASISFLKQDLFALLADEGYARDSITFGTLVEITVREWGSAADFERLFYGNVTDMASDAYEIRFSLVDHYLYLASGAAQTNSLLYNEEIFTYTNAALNAALGFSPLVSQMQASTNAYVALDLPITYTNPLPYLDPIIQQGASNYLYSNIGADSLVISSRPPSGFQIPIEITSDEVLLDYSIDRNIDDVCNSVTVVYESGSYSKVNQTSIDAIGVRHQTIQTGLTDYPDVVALAFWYLGAHSPAGYPVVSFRTAAELLGLTASQIALQIQPNAKLDVSQVTADGFEDRAYIEQVRHTIDRSQWRIELVISNSDYSELSQTWSQVSPSLLWDDVLNDPNNFLSWDDLLYTYL